MPAPADCMTKEQVRAEIDRLDSELIAKLGERFAYVRRMAELKEKPAEADDPGRVEAVMEKIDGEAEAAGLDRALVKMMWRRLIDWNIAWERNHIGTRNDH